MGIQSLCLPNLGGSYRSHFTCHRTSTSLKLQHRYKSRPGQGQKSQTLCRDCCGVSLKSLFLRLVRVHEKERERERQREREEERERESETTRARERGSVEEVRECSRQIHSESLSLFLQPRTRFCDGTLMPHMLQKERERERERGGDRRNQGERESERETFFICIHAMK